jgi:hypothetical protein
MEATILTEYVIGERVFIPRIPLMPPDYWFEFTSKEIPVKLLFAMITTEAQGQSLNEVSIDLREGCFSHGQLYVACSKVGSSKGLGHIYFHLQEIQQMLLLKKFCVEFSS